MQHSKKLAVLKELLRRLTGQSLADDFAPAVERKSSSFPDPEKRRLDILRQLLRRLVA